MPSTLSIVFLNARFGVIILSTISFCNCEYFVEYKIRVAHKFISVLHTYMRGN
jgi:hypothetical protein